MHLLVKIVLLAAAIVASPTGAAAEAEKSIELVTIPIRERDNIYQGLESRLLRSEDDADTLIDDLFANNRWISRRSWGEEYSEHYDKMRRASNRRIAEVRKAFDKARVDYGEETVGVVFVASSGSNRFTVGEPRLDQEVLTLVLEKDAPRLQTADMVFRAFVIRVPRSVAKQVRVPAERGKFRTYDLATGEEIVEEAGKSDVAPKSMASPRRKSGE